MNRIYEKVKYGHKRIIKNATFWSKIQGATVQKDFFSLNTMYVPSKCMQLWAQRNISERSNRQQYDCEKLKRYIFFTNVKLLLLFIVRTIKH